MRGSLGLAVRMRSLSVMSVLAEVGRDGVNLRTWPLGMWRLEAEMRACLRRSSAL